MPAVDESSAPHTHAVREFYDALAPQYDAMTSFAKRFEKEGPAIRALVERYGMKRALDAGCGSGFHSIVLAQLGVEVTALDLSPEMLRMTEENARTYHVEIKTLRAAFQDIPAAWREMFDAVFVMGNSLPHLLSYQELADSLRSLMAVLRPGGRLIAQCLNYDRILNRKDHILNAREVNGDLITRKYDYDSDGIRFSIVTQKRGKTDKPEKRESVRLRPILKDELMDLLQDVGTTPDVFGNILLGAYDPSTSLDLIVVATKR